MNLFAAAFRIACKHSSRRLLCLLCVLAVCAGLGAAAFSTAAGEDSPVSARVAVISLDENPLSRMALRSAASMQNLSSLLELDFLETGADTTGYTAVITIPDGFLESVMNGENRPPLVEADATTPLEAMLVRQLAEAGARYLTAAQRGIYTVQEGADYGASMTPEAYNFLLADVNLSYLKLFANRLSLVDAQKLSASGALSLPQYYAAALVTVLFLCYGFLYQPAVEDLRRFARRAPHGTGGIALPMAAFLHILFLCMASVLPVFLLCGKLYGFTAEGFTAYLLFALLTGAFAFLLSLLLRTRASCAAGCMLISVGMGFCSGCFLPLSLMPPLFARIAPFTVTGQGQRLLAAMQGEAVPFAARSSLLMTLVLLTACALLWRFSRKEGID